MYGPPDWLFSFIVWFFIGIAALIIIISAIPYLYEWQIRKFYGQIANEYGWQYEKRIEKLPNSTVTKHGKAYSKFRSSVFRRWIATAGIGQRAGPAVFGEHNTRKFTLAHYAEIVHIHRAGDYATHYTLMGTGHKGISGTAYISKEALLQKLGKALGIQDIELNDPLFDPMFRIKGDYANIGIVLDIAARRFLSKNGW